MVYVSGNLNECSPMPKMLGRSPAFGMIFQDKVNVTFWCPLQRKWYLKNYCKLEKLNNIYFKLVPASQK